MFKVSFKDTAMQPSKVVMKAGRSTITTLRGTIRIPHFWKHIPENIAEWVANQTHVELYEDMANNVLHIYVEGTSTCREDDKYDTILGERLAESRAKHQIYLFILHLCEKLRVYYTDILIGEESAYVGHKNSLSYTCEKYRKLANRELQHQKEFLDSKKHE